MKIYASTSEDRKHKILESLVGKDLWIKAKLYEGNLAKNDYYVHIIKKLRPQIGFDYEVNRIMDSSDLPGYEDSQGRITLDAFHNAYLAHSHWMNASDIHPVIPIEVYTSEELFIAPEEEQ